MALRLRDRPRAAISITIRRKEAIGEKTLKIGFVS
jgi:hypothetical protein